MSESLETQEEIIEALKKSPDGLTGPQLHSLVVGTWEDIKFNLALLVLEGKVKKTDTPFSTEAYPGFRLLP